MSKTLVLYCAHTWALKIKLSFLVLNFVAPTHGRLEETLARASEDCCLHMAVRRTTQTLSDLKSCAHTWAVEKERKIGSPPKLRPHMGG